MVVSVLFRGMRRQLPGKDSMTFEQLVQQCVRCFPILGTQNFTVTYTDDEGDQVCIGTDFEFADALLLSNYNLLLKLVSGGGGASGAGDGGGGGGAAAVISPQQNDLSSSRMLLADDVADNIMLSSVGGPISPSVSFSPVATGPSKRRAADALLAPAASTRKVAATAGAANTPQQRVVAPKPRQTRSSATGARSSSGTAAAQVDGSASRAAAAQGDSDDGDDIGGTEEERKIKKRERNRVNAKKSRLRKKFFIDSLKVTIENLKSENEALKKQLEAVKQRETGTQPRINVVLNEPKVVGRCYCITNPALHDNPIVYASDSFCTLTGYARSEIIGRNCRFLQGPQTDNATVARIRDRISKGQDVSEVLINYRKDGRAFCNHVMISAARDDNGKINHFVGVLEDMTHDDQSPTVPGSKTHAR